jgi:hypothetical protein
VEGGREDTHSLSLGSLPLVGSLIIACCFALLGRVWRSLIWWGLRTGQLPRWLLNMWCSETREIN